MSPEIDNVLDRIANQYSHKEAYRLSNLFMLACIEGKQDLFPAIVFDSIETAKRYWRDHSTGSRSELREQRITCWKQHDTAQKNSQIEPDIVLSFRIVLCALYDESSSDGKHICDLLDLFIEFFEEKFPDSKDFLLEHLYSTFLQQ